MNNIRLNNGTYIPEIGFGTWKAPKEEITIDAVKEAINAGYTHIDCAAIYGNEKFVGEGIKQSKANREDLFIVSKVWNENGTYEDTINAFNKTISDLNVDYLDLYLIHWPNPIKYRNNHIERNKEVWRALETLYNEGKVKAIGVSNFKPTHIEELLKSATIKPMVNQIQFHISVTQKETREYCKKHNIIVEGYTPLAKGGVFNIDTLKELANKYNVSIARLCLKYSIQSNVIPLCKSVTVERIKDNIKMDFIISDEDMNIIDNINDLSNNYIDSDTTDF